MSENDSWAYDGECPGLPTCCHCEPNARGHRFGSLSTCVNAALPKCTVGHDPHACAVFPGKCCACIVAETGLNLTYDNGAVRVSNLAQELRDMGKVNAPYVAGNIPNLCYCTGWLSTKHGAHAPGSPGCMTNRPDKCYCMGDAWHPRGARGCVNSTHAFRDVPDDNY